MTTTQERPAGAAFFDVDKTLLPGSSMYLFARGLYDAGLYRLRDIAGFALGQLAFRVSGAEGKRGMTAARESASRFIQGRRQDDLEEVTRRIVDEFVVTRVYPGMRGIIDAHRGRGERTFLVTAVPADFAQLLAARLGLDGALGTQAELVDGVYTGNLVGPVLHGPEKAAAVRRLAEATGIDLAASSAYSDSVNDRPLLESVGHPVAVNPDRELRALARERGWPVAEFRAKRRLYLVWGPALVAGASAAALLELARRHWRDTRTGPARVERASSERRAYPARVERAYSARGERASSASKSASTNPLA